MKYTCYDASEYQLWLYRFFFRNFEKKIMNFGKKYFVLWPMKIMDPSCVLYIEE